MLQNFTFLPLVCCRPTRWRRRQRSGRRGSRMEWWRTKTESWTWSSLPWLNWRPAPTNQVHTPPLHTIHCPLHTCIHAHTHKHKPGNLPHPTSYTPPQQTSIVDLIWCNDLQCVNSFTAQFEGSLGRLTTSSVHNPRQIIDVRSDAKPHGEESESKNVSKELRRSRQLLMEIENVSYTDGNWKYKLHWCK